MKKTILTLSIFFAGYYAYANGLGDKDRFVQSGDTPSSCVYQVPGDTTKSASTDTTQVSDRTQQVLDSIQNAQSGGSSYGSYTVPGASYNYNETPAEGTRKPNSYKSGRTGGQYDPVWKPGMDKKKEDK